MMCDMKEIIGFPNYNIYNDGRIWSKVSNRFLSTNVHDNGYIYVDLCKDGKKYSKRLHILVAQHFISNTDNLPEVNHKDGNKLNPHYTNLEWTTRSNNVIHALNTGLQKCRKITEQLLNGKVIATYKSCAEASRMTGIGESTINNACAGRRKTAGGYEWRYRDAK